MIDERTQFEMYYPPFESAIEAEVGSFMCSYNPSSTLFGLVKTIRLSTLILEREWDSKVMSCRIGEQLILWLLTRVWIKK